MARRWDISVLVAVWLLGISLGLPWGTQNEWRPDGISSFTPQWCQVVISPVNGFAGNWCISGATSSNSRLVTRTVVGAEHPARFGLVAAIAVLLLAGARRTALVGGLVAANVLWCGGLGFSSGGVAAAWLAAIVLGCRALAGRSTALKPSVASLTSAHDFHEIGGRGRAL